MRLNSLIRKVLVLTIGSSVLLAACGGGSDGDSKVRDPFNGADQKTTSQPHTGGSLPQANTTRPTATPTKTAEQLQPPVDFTLHGLSANKKTVSFTISSPKDITRYVVTTRYLDAQGNLVKAILNGSGSGTPGARVLVPAGTATELKVNAQIDPRIESVEGWVAELVFADGTSWKRGQ